MSGTAIAAAALREEAQARETMAEIYEEAGNEEAVKAELARAEYLRELAERIAAVPLISLVYGEGDVRDYADEAGVSEAVALKRAQEWAKYIQDTAASLCSEQLLAVVRNGQP